MTGGTLVNPGGVSTLNFTGGSASAGFTQSGGTFNDGNINFGVGTGKTLTLNNNLTAASSRTFTVSGTGALVVPSGVTLAVGGTLTGGGGGTTINGTFQINQGGWGTGGTWTYGSSSTLAFNNSSGSYTVNNTDVFWPTTSGPQNVNVSGAGGLTLNSANRTVSGIFQTAAGVTLTTSTLTLNGTAQINVGGFFNQAPVYGASSTLKYNTGTTYGRNAEWSATSGAGYPNHVQLSGNTTLNVGANSGTAIARQMAGNLTIDSGSTFEMAGANPMTAAVTVNGSVLNSGTLRLSGSVGGDIYVAGDWTRAAAATFTPNGRAVFFAGSAVQTVSVTGGGTAAFDYLVNNNSSGGVKLSSSPATSASINATAGDVLSLTGAGPFDLNGQTLTLNGAGGNILTAGASRTISSSTAGGSVVIAGNKTASGTGLVFGDNLAVKLSAGMNFGSSVSTIGGGTSGTLQINTGGYVNGNAPKYASGSLLQYNSGTTYGRGLEFSASSGTVGVTAGYPFGVQISGNTTLNYPNGSAPGALAVGGSLTVDSGSALYMDYGNPSGASEGALTVLGNVSLAGNLSLGNLTGGDLYVGGNWVRNGTFTPNGRAIFFNGTSGQSISGATTFDYLFINDASGVTLSSSAAVNATLTLTSGTLDMAGNSLAADKLSGASGINNSGAEATLTLGGNGGSCAFSGSVSGALALNKSGVGTLTLGNASTYTGATTVSGGTLALGSSGGLANSPIIAVAQSAVFDVTAVTGGFNVGSEQTIKGKGTVTGNATIQGTLAAGSSVGTLTETGSLTWAPGGTNEVEMSSATGVPGTDWDLLSISGDLTVTATNHVGGALSDVNKFKIRLVSLPGFSGFADNTQSNAWTIATVSGSVKEFIPSKFVVDTRSFTQDLAGTFSVALENKEVKLVYTPTTCSATTASYYVENNPGNKLVVMTFANTAGLTSVQALRMDNCSITGWEYPNISDATNSVNGSAISGNLSLTTRTLLDRTTKKVVLWAKKDSQTIDAVVNVLVMDNCGGGKSFDPVITTLSVASGNRVQQRFEGVLSAERYLHVVNSTPGLKWLEVNLNGRVFRLDPLADGQDLSADLASAMHEGDNNTVILTGGGDVGASAVVMITDTAAGSLIALPEVVALALSQTPGGLALAWPDTLAGWQLQSSATTQGAWADVTATPALAGGQFTVTVPTADTAQFYRLHQITSNAVTGTASEAAVNLSGAPQSQPLQHTYDGLLW